MTDAPKSWSQRTWKWCKVWLFGFLVGIGAMVALVRTGHWK